jgi:hypothetical protein
MTGIRFSNKGSRCGMIILKNHETPRRSEIERAFRLFHGPARHAVGVDHRGPDVGVPQKRLDGADVVVGLQQVRCKAVAEGVGGDALRDLGLPDSFTCSDLKSGGGYLTRKSR